jgi:hypothetical protein
MRREARRKGDRLIEFVAIGVVVFDLNKFIAVVLFSRLLTLRLPRSERGEEMPREGFLTLPRIQIFFELERF